MYIEVGPLTIMKKEVVGMQRVRRQKGQGLVEYALILTFVAVVVIIILAFFGPTISGVFSNIISGL